MDISALIARQMACYPALCVQDLIKALYQATLGCGHFAPSRDAARKRLAQEIARLPATQDVPLVEPLCAYSRVHLAPFLALGGDCETLCALFLMSAQPETPQARAAFDAALSSLEALLPTLPRPPQDSAEALCAYRAAGCPAAHHSPAFNAAYDPAYRVIRSEYAQILPLLIAIDNLKRKKPRALIAIDGMCAGGKTTLAALLAQLYGAQVCHMDDFFLRPQQRTQQRLKTPGENVDHERFHAQVLTPLLAGKPFVYRPYSCHTQDFLPPQARESLGLTIIEGSYSLHEQLAPAYDLRVFIRVDCALQQQRIQARNGHDQLDVFLSRWIPLETLYFQETRILSRADVILDVRPAVDDNRPDAFEVIIHDHRRH